MKPIQKVLVIKLGGVGEMVLAFPAFERIRQAHPQAKITLLTTEPFEALAKSSPFFNAVEADGAPKDPGHWTALILRIRRAHYDRVYDLQNDAATNLIFQALRPAAAGLVGHGARRLAAAPQPPSRRRCTRWSGRPSSCRTPASGRTRRPSRCRPRRPTSPGSSPAAPQPRSVTARRRAPAGGAAGARRAMRTIPSSAGRSSSYGGFAERMQDAGFDIVIIGALQRERAWPTPSSARRRARATSPAAPTSCRSPRWAPARRWRSATTLACCT